MFEYCVGGYYEKIKYCWEVFDEFVCVVNSLYVKWIL